MAENVWKQMYMGLAGSVADAVELIQEPQEKNPVKQILIRAMQDAEEIYIRDGDPDADGETPENS